jgi:hypothetical protein
VGLVRLAAPGTRSSTGSRRAALLGDVGELHRSYHPSRHRFGDQLLENRSAGTCAARLKRPALRRRAWSSVPGRGAQLSAIGFGCMGLVGWYGERNDVEARAAVLEA